MTRRNLPEPLATTWLADATADIELLQDATGLKIEDATPEGHLNWAHRVTQFPDDDITRRASTKRVQGLIRGVMAKYPQCRRIGILTHSTLVDAANNLGAVFDERVAMVACFGSGADRASNRWHNAHCDLLIVAGTPRINGLTVKKILFQCNRLDAIRRDGDWGDVQWKDSTPSGKSRLISGRGYRDRDWRQAQRSKVRAGIIQAVGRSRAMLESGCDVAILSSEECGFPVVDADGALKELDETALEVLNELSAICSLITHRDDCRYSSTRALAQRLRIEERQCRNVLKRLEVLGLVERLGERKGWRLSPNWLRVEQEQTR